MPYVETSVGRLFVQASGRGQVVSFWHCLLGDSGIWQDPCRSLGARSRAVLVDGPGHGRSAPPAHDFTLEQCADAWVRALDESGSPEPAVLVGLSWGALVALRVALQHPERVRALVLFGAIASAPPRRARLQFAVLARALRTFGVARWMQPRLVSAMVSPRCTPDVRHGAAQMLQRCATLDRLALYRAARAVLVSPTPLNAQLPRIHAPAALCVGSDDRVTPPVCSRRIVEAMPHATLHKVDGAGHLLPLEAPARTAELIDAVLRSQAS